MIYTADNQPKDRKAPFSLGAIAIAANSLSQNAIGHRLVIKVLAADVT